MAHLRLMINNQSHDVNALPETPLLAHLYVSDLEIGCGLSSSTTGSALSAHFDNVLVRVQ